MSPQGTQQWLHAAFFQSNGVSAVRGVTLHCQANKGHQAYPVCVQHSCYSAFPQVLEAKHCPFQTRWWPFPSSALPQPRSCQHWAQLPNYTGFGDHHSAELPSTHWWTHHPVAFHPTSQPALFPVFFPSCFSRFALAYWTAFSAWQQLEKIHGAFQL